MPLQATSGAASYDAFGGGVPVEPVYIEQIFQTYLYTGNGSTQTITNGIDLAGEGGLVWQKLRDTATNHALIDTARGGSYYLQSNTTGAEDPAGATTFNADGYSLGSANGRWNGSGYTYASWTFRKQPKFFDVVTYSGNSDSSQVISHNLGSVPGFMIIKCTNVGPSDWPTYHRSMGNTSTMWLNQTGGINTQLKWWNNTSPTDTQFTVGNDSDVNASGRTYVAYLFAHDAGGFGLTGTDNVISCGSYTGNGSTSGPAVNLGYEPQWVMIKNATDATNWAMFDNMRGIATGGTEQRLYANTSGAEVTTSGNDIDLTATGFDIKTDLGYLNTSGSTFIYIAIRRGPMKVPTLGTSVFSPIAVTNSAGSNNTTNFPVDLQINSLRSAASKLAVDRLRGVSTTATNIGSQLVTNSTAAEAGSGAGSITRNWSNTGFQTSDEYGSLSTIYWNFRRAPGFFDEVITPDVYTTGIVNHNLTVTPELMIEKTRSTSTTNWRVYHKDIAAGGALNLSDAFNKSLYPRNPTSTTFEYANNNAVVYLFASCPGVSKVGSYTGTGTTQTINCGFTGGARFVLIKRTDSTGDWYVWDSARGIVAGNDPYLLLNSTAAEVTSTDYVDTYSAGFEISSTAPAAINASGGSFIFLAIA